MELIPEAEAKDKVLHLGRKLYRWSKEETYVLKKIYNLIHNPNVLSLAWYLLRRNAGSRTAGTDGITRKTVEEEIGIEKWLTDIQRKLSSKTHIPNTVRRTYIPKPGKSEKRPLGIPTLEDRLVQMALKIILEPIFEARFKGCSLGFRPSRGPIHAISTVGLYMRPYSKYDWVIEADIRNCFGNIDHGILLNQIKKTIPDKKILSIIRGFLKAGIMEENEIRLPVTGSPQGGIISPLLANIYLNQLDEIYHEKYHTLTYHYRCKYTEQGKPLFRLIRYADDFVIMVKGSRAQAEEELNNIRIFLKNNLKMELAEEKSGVCSLTDGFDFLGYRFWRGPSLRTRKTSTILLPSKEALIRFRRKVKDLTSKATTHQDPDDMLRKLNYLIRGWGQYFKYGWVAKTYKILDYYIFFKVAKWFKKKHKRQSKKKHSRHNRKYNRGTWKWIIRKYFRPDITGKRRWTGTNYRLQTLRESCRPTKAPWPKYEAITPYNCAEKYIQTCITDFKTGRRLTLGMEILLQRHRNW